MLDQAYIAADLAVLLVVAEGAAEYHGQVVDGNFDHIEQEVLNDVDGSAVLGQKEQVA